MMVKVPAKTFLSCSKRENDQKGHHQEFRLWLDLILAIFLSFVHQNDFILSILIFLNSLNNLVMVSLMLCKVK